MQVLHRLGELSLLTQPSNSKMKIALIISAFFALYAFFATSKMLPNWVHFLCSRGYDKHAHCAIFFVLEIMCVLVFRDYAPLSIAAVLSCLGVWIEIGQHYTHRTGDILDVFSNCAGLFFALLIIQFFNSLKFSL